MPSPRLYRVTVSRLEKWSDILDSLSKELEDEETEEEEGSDSDAHLIKVGYRQPHYVSPKNRCESGSWSSSLRNFSASLCVGKRRKREPEVGDDEEEGSDWFSACGNGKRRRTM